MVILANHMMEVQVHPLGAELHGLKNLRSGIQHLWSGDPAFWGKRSPVLFPIVGSLLNGCYAYKGTWHSMGRHGFAREKPFTAAVHGPSRATFTLTDDEQTRIVYPFAFVLQLEYSLEGERLTVTYRVTNPADRPMYFSIGGHPAFAVPYVDGLRYEDHYLEFESRETVGRKLLHEGLLADGEEAFLLDSRRVDLHPSLFERDAVVLQGLKSEYLELRTSLSPHGIRFGIADWPHLGLWAARGAPFLCIEPWQGHADPTGHDGDLTRKPGIVELGPYADWERSWWVETF